MKKIIALIALVCSFSLNAQITTTPVSQMSSAGTLTGSEILAIQKLVSGKWLYYKTTTQAIANLSSGSGGTVDSNIFATKYYVNALLTGYVPVQAGKSLSTNDFTNVLLAKLNGIAAGATNVTNTNQLTNGAGFITNASGLISQGSNITITGSGTSGTPYVINSTTVVDTTVLATRLYVNSGLSSKINTVQISAPTGLVAIGGHSQITISWNRVPFATSYDIKLATNSGFTTGVLNAVTTDTFIVIAATNGTPYYYEVRGTNSAPAVYLTSSYTVGSGTVTPASVNVGKVRIMWIGDSVFEGVGSFPSGTWSYPTQLRGILDTAIYDRTDHNIAAAGSSSNFWIARIKYVADAHYNSSSSMNIVEFNNGINDASNNYPTYKSQMIAIMQYLKSEGWKVNLHTFNVAYKSPATPRKNSGREYDWSYEARNNKTAYGITGIVDIVNDQYIGQIDTPSRAYWMLDSNSGTPGLYWTTGYSPSPGADGIHFGRVGYAYRTTIAKPVLDSIAALASIIPPAPTLNNQNVGTRKIVINPVNGTLFSDFEYSVDGAWTWNTMVDYEITLPDPKMTYIKTQIVFRRKQKGNNPPSEKTVCTIDFPATNPGLTGTDYNPSDTSIVKYSLSYWNYYPNVSGTQLGFTTPFIESKVSAGYAYSDDTCNISFNKGIKIVNLTTVNNNPEIYYDGKLVHQYRPAGNTINAVLFEAYPNDANTHYITIKAGTQKAYIGKITKYN